MCKSVPQMPAARTARSTCPGPGRGWDSSRSATLPAPRAVFMTACMVVMLAPPLSRRIQRWILLHVESHGIILQKAQQGIALLPEHDGFALRQSGKGCEG